MADLIKRSVDDENFEHCARAVMPFCIELIRGLEEDHELDRNTITCIGIVAEVAQAFAEREYGKPRWRITKDGQIVPLFVTTPDHTAG